ncbi:flagellar protein FliT [Janthinobacterium fluminis]|uniref:Flagellar protein FliT n=1 Tax=Janthinobacterium fluminis TaxID=2987524 RepID=A0ABT5JXT2_9BURK|nr:flagellar protein FliT [Janthinobacterium fluminis]MDC8757444.1 flagellar protein FliT [Janthinobacterium fluminis]
MTSTEVLSMYENIAGMTNQMVKAARASDWDSLSQLEKQCASEARGATAGAVPALSGTPRMRKIDLLKQILANDREIRAVTEPWMTQLANVMPAPRPNL